uniref:Putative rve-domain-containing protein n=1 Tax=Moniliophthora roreri TaxID=221103 RepID=A0A0W0EYQ3_MONRR
MSLFSGHDKYKFTYLETQIEHLDVLQTLAAATRKAVDTVVAHNCFGHIPEPILCKCATVCKGFSIGGLLMFEHSCTGCAYGSVKQQLYLSSTKQAMEILDLIHMDLVEFPIVLYPNQFKYALTILDDYSSHGWSALQRSKTQLETLASFKAFQQQVEKQTGKQIKTMHIDHRGEFFGTIFQGYLKDSGI